MSVSEDKMTLEQKAALGRAQKAFDDLDYNSTTTQYRFGRAAQYHDSRTPEQLRQIIDRELRAAGQNRWDYTALRERHWWGHGGHLGSDVNSAADRFSKIYQGHKFGENGPVGGAKKQFENAGTTIKTAMNNGTGADEVIAAKEAAKTYREAREEYARARRAAKAHPHDEFSAEALRGATRDLDTAKADFKDKMATLRRDERFAREGDSRYIDDAAKRTARRRDGSGPVRDRDIEAERRDIQRELYEGEYAAGDRQRPRAQGQQNRHRGDRTYFGGEEQPQYGRQSQRNNGDLYAAGGHFYGEGRQYGQQLRRDQSAGCPFGFGEEPSHKKGKKSDWYDNVHGSKAWRDLHQ